MPRTTERGTKTIFKIKFFNKTLELRYHWTKYYREDVMTGEKSYWDGVSE